MLPGVQGSERRIPQPVLQPLLSRKAAGRSDRQLGRRFRHISIMRIILTLAIALCWAATESAPQAAERLPNIVLILTDDQGYADVGKFGAEGFTTPNLDRMAEQGAIFRNFHVAQPVCSASRCALLTGCYPNRLGIHNALGPKSKVGISDQEVTLAQLLKTRGYATAIFGKWHLGDSPQFLPLRHGFDTYFGLPLSCDFWPDHPNLITNFPASIVALKREYPNLPIYDGDKKFREEMTIDDLNHLTTWYTERSVKFIDDHQSGPFFLYVAHSMPHVPLGVSEKFRGKSARGLYGDVIEEVDCYEVNQLQSVTSGNGRWKLQLPHTYVTMQGQPQGRDGVPGEYAHRKIEHVELYDLVHDLGETTDIAADHPDVVAQLTAEVEKARAELGDALTKRTGAGTRQPGRLANPAAPASAQ
jgi:hypothetical protein